MLHPLRTSSACCLLIGVALLSACAAAPVHPDPRDPFERINRPLFKFDDALAHDVAIPVGHAYEKVTPRFVRTGIANFFDNLHTPAVLVNDFLQAKFTAGFTDLGRLVLNSVVGLGGLLDPATPAGLAKNDNDFGRTLGTWGLPPGPYLVLPALGPSDIRDAVGRVPDGYMGPVNYISYSHHPWLLYGMYGLSTINDTVVTIIPTYRLLDSQGVFDRYAFARNAWLQRRQFLITGQQGAADQDELELQKSLEEDAGPDTPGGTAPGK